MKQNNKNIKPTTGIQMKNQKNQNKTPANLNSWVGQPLRGAQLRAASAALGMVMVDRVSNGLSALPQSSTK